MHPVLFKIPGVDWPLHTYGVLIVIGFLLAMYVAHREAKRQGRFADEVLDFAFWALLGGMIGARVVFIVVNWREYFIDNFWDKVGPIPLRIVLMGIGGIAALVAGIGLLDEGKKNPVRIAITAVGLAIAFIGWRFVDAQLGPFSIPSIFVVWKGGLVFYGSALGGLFAFLWYTKKRGILGVDRLAIADIMVIGVPLAHAFGRLGCVAAGCCWGDAAYHIDPSGGVVSDIPMAAYFPEGSLAYQSLITTVDGDVAARMREMHTTMPLIPIQLIEAFGEGVIFIILLFVRSRKWFHGQVLLTYGILYPILRVINETMRGDAERGYVIPGVLSTSQFISLCVASAALITILVLRKRGMANTQTPSTPA